VAAAVGATGIAAQLIGYQLANAAGVIRASVHQALSELRDVIAVLRDTESETDWSEHPQPVLADLPGLIEEASSAGTHIQLDNRVRDSAEPPAAVGRTAYRVVQEGLTNARKHAAGQPVRVILSGAAGAQLTIEMSNPVPASPAAAPVAPGSGTGLVGLSERVQLAGGELEHQLASGEFRMRAWIPWPV
jgi:signal transduction histidine kinase